MTERVLSQANHLTLNWINADTFRINISELIPESYAQTTAQRRKRFYRDFVPMIEQHGWVSEGEGRWRKFIRRSE
jgi:hypothetical protein